MDQGKRRLDPLVAEIRVELLQLRRGQHALVDDGAARQRREVDALNLVLDPLAKDVDEPFERQPGQAGVAIGAGDEHLAEGRLHGQSPGSEHRVVGWHVAPSDDGEALGVADLGDERRRRAGLGRLRGEEGDARRVAAVGRQVELDNLAEEPVGDLHEDPGAVARVDLGAGRAPVLEVAERAEPELDDLVALAALDIDHERHTAGIVLESGVVEALGLRERWHQ